jgi:hypothetical protein
MDGTSVTPAEHDLRQGPNVPPLTPPASRTITSEDGATLHGDPVIDNGIPSGYTSSTPSVSAPVSILDSLIAIIVLLAVGRVLRAVCRWLCGSKLEHAAYTGLRQSAADLVEADEDSDHRRTRTRTKSILVRFNRTNEDGAVTTLEVTLDLARTIQTVAGLLKVLDGAAENLDLVQFGDASDAYWKDCTGRLHLLTPASDAQNVINLAVDFVVDLTSSHGQVAASIGSESVQAYF